MDFITGKNFRQFRTSLIGQFVHPVGGGEDVVKEEVVILVSYKFHFIRVHDNLV